MSDPFCLRGSSSQPGCAAGRLSEEIEQLKDKLSAATRRAADLESKRAAEILEAENEVWDMVIQACHDAWPEDKKVFYNESPTELITDIINERDEAVKRAAGLEKDAARLDALQDLMADGETDVVICPPGNHGAGAHVFLLCTDPGNIFVPGQEWTGVNLRAAIDAAIGEGEHG